MISIFGNLPRFLPGGGGIISFLTGVPMSVWIGLALVVSHAYAMNWARNAERSVCETAALRAEVVELKRQNAAAQEVARLANEQAEKTWLDNLELDKKVREYEKHIADDPKCQLTADDIRLQQAAPKKPVRKK